MCRAAAPFPHPLNPPGGFPVEWAIRTYDALLSSGVYAFQRYVFFRYRVLAIYDMPFVDRLLYRYLIIPYTRREILKNERENYYWMPERPDWGPGRTDMNPFQRQVLRLPDDHSIGSTDVMAIWNERVHKGMLYHADGLNTTLVESVRSAALSAGATKASLDIASLDRLQQYLLDLPPPKFPFPVDHTAAEKGSGVFKRECAECHAFGGRRTGTVMPLQEVGTDPNRNRHWTQTAAEAFNRWAVAYPWAFHNFRSSNGYVALALGGIWARAPYPHNGSVPNIRQLLTHPNARVQVFYRGYDVYDPQNLGFMSAGIEAEQAGFRYDTRVKGNGNEGHLYGTALADTDKNALIEYLKTL